MLENLPPRDPKSYNVLQKEIGKGGLMDSTMDSVDYAFEPSLNCTADYRRLIDWANPRDDPSVPQVKMNGFHSAYFL